MYGFFGYRLKSRPDAEDLTQRTFERALAAWDRFDPRRSNEQAWLLTIARNLLIDHFRRDRSDRLMSLDDAAAGPDSVPIAPDVDANLGLDPDLEVALAKLGDRDRELIALRFGADLTGSAIAEMTGSSLAAVQQALSRALRKLRADLEAEASRRPGDDSSGAHVAGR